AAKQALWGKKSPADVVHKALSNRGWVSTHSNRGIMLYTHPAFAGQTIQMRQDGTWAFNGPLGQDTGNVDTIVPFLGSLRPPKATPESGEPEPQTLDNRGYGDDATEVTPVEGADESIVAGEVDGLGEMKVKMKLNLDEPPEKAQEKVVEGATAAA